MYSFVLRRFRLRIAVSTLLAFACAVPLLSWGQDANNERTADKHPLSVEQWREDLRYLAE